MHTLGQDLWFPDPRTASKGDIEGLLAVGGDLSVERLLLAYRSGIFPWTARPISWWSPDPRAIFEWDRIHISRSLGKFLRKHPFTLTRDQAFREVVQGCRARAPGRPSTWIASEFVEAYTRLHQAGHAHSVECWLDGRLVGGVYGVHVGGLFAGESMFHRVPNASKVALHYLFVHLRERGFQLLDTQVLNPTTQDLGAVEISRDEYLQRLEKAVNKRSTF